MLVDQSLVRSGDLAEHLYRGRGRLRRLKAIWKRVEEDPALSKVNRNSMNHQERYIEACRKIHFFKLICEEERGKPAGNPCVWMRFTTCIYQWTRTCP